MRFLGNYKEWIEPEWIERILTTEGYVAPRDVNFSNKERSEMHESERRIYDTYGIDSEFFNLLESNILNFNINPPWINEKFQWWVTKMKPGQFIPVHSDGPKHMKGDRYWMPLTDWEPGHIFIYKDQSVSNYKAGDLWVYNEAMAMHGAINIGYSIRLVLQVSTFGEHE